MAVDLTPALTFGLPSLYDEKSVECRVYHPDDASLPHGRGAIFAHPYATLGGSFDDPVVLDVTSTLLEKGYIVLTFNFRGTENSGSASSWTGRPELSDYLSVVGFIVSYLHHTEPLSPAPEGSTKSGVGPPPAASRYELILGGYSYGALQTMQLPPVEEIIARFKYAEVASVESRIMLQAEELGTQQRKVLLQKRRDPWPSTSGDADLADGEERPVPDPGRPTPDSNKFDAKAAAGTEAPLPARAVAVDNISMALPSVRYLLVSPLLPPLAWFISLSSTALGIWAAKSQSSNPMDDGKLHQNPTLAVYGSKDNFTGHKKLKTWSDRLAGKEGSRFRSAALEGGNHFWAAMPSSEWLRRAVGDWATTDEREGSSG